MKYYILLLLSSPVLALNFTVLRERPLTQQEISDFRAVLPQITDRNFQTELAAKEKLEVLIHKALDDLQSNLNEIEACKKSTEKALAKKVNTEAIQIRNNQEIILRLCYLHKAETFQGNLRIIHQVMSSNIERYQSKKQKDDTIKSLMDTIERIDKADPVDSEKMLADFCASLGKLSFERYESAV
jgi:hypothetical protein